MMQESIQVAVAFVLAAAFVALLALYPPGASPAVAAKAPTVSTQTHAKSPVSATTQKSGGGAASSPGVGCGG